MSPFDYFFTLYGLILGLSVSVIATGFATAIQHRRSLRIGALTPLLATFVCLDIASFWETAWRAFRGLPFSYGLLVAGMVIALVYFIAASLVFPHRIEDGMALDDHFWANKRPALLLTSAANTLLVLAVVALTRGQGSGALIANYLVTSGLYLLLIIPAALSRRRPVVIALLGLHTAVYLLIAVANLAGTSLDIPDNGVGPRRASPAPAG